MRYAFALALLALVAACSSAPAPTRCTPGASVPCVCPGVGIGAQVCASDGESYGACACAVLDAGDDAVAVVDAVAADVVAVVDATSADVVTEDRPAAVDAGGVDVVDVVDVDPRQTPECRGVTQVCDGRTVNVQGGERDGGLTYHCGRCGVTCGAGEFCVTCRCER